MEVYFNQSLVWVTQLYKEYYHFFYLIPFLFLVMLGAMKKIVVYKNFSETIASPLLFTLAMLFVYVVVTLYKNYVNPPYNHIDLVRNLASIPLVILIIRDMLITYRNNNRHIVKTILAILVRLPLSLILASWITMVLIVKATKDDADAGVLKVIPFITIFLMIITTRDKCLSDESAELVNRIYRQVTGKGTHFAESMTNGLR